MSHYVDAIMNAIDNHDGDIIVEATAGSGKSTLLFKIINHVDTDAGIILAFNVSIKDESELRLNAMNKPGWETRTLHSLGMRILNSHGSYDVVKNKVQNLVYESLKNKRWPKKKWGAVYKQTIHMVDLIRLSMLDPDNIDDLNKMAARHSMSEAETVVPLARKLYDESMRLAEDEQKVDFADMLYLPIIWGLKIPAYEWVLLDEAQDMSPIQIELVRSIIAPNGRMVAVGDEFQSIYGWASADSEAIRMLGESARNPIRLPLSITWRCATSIVEIAKEFSPRIEARPDAPEGTIISIPESDLATLSNKGDMVLCRVNAPLIPFCVHTIKSGTPARIADDQYGSRIVGLIESAYPYKKGKYSQKELMSNVEAYASEVMDKLRNQDNMRAANDWDDLRKAALACIQAFRRAETIDSLSKNIRKLFKAKDKNVVRYSSVHKAKGLESDTVYILKPNKLPHLKFATEPWMIQQEMNVKFVAVTRAKNNLVWVHEDNDFLKLGGYTSDQVDSPVFQQAIARLGLNHDSAREFLLQNEYTPFLSHFIKTAGDPPF